MGTLIVLLVEDNLGDVALLRDVIKRESLAVQLHVVSDGEQALQFLRRDNVYVTAPTPDVVLLDLHIPKVSGHDVLAAMRSIGLHYIPVVILSSSSSEADIRKAYRLHANAYVTKPLDLMTYVARIRGILQFFGTHVVRLAPCSSHSDLRG